MRRLRRGLRAVVRSGYTQLFIGIVIVITAVIEAEGALLTGLGSGNLRSEHGSALFGIFVILQSLQQLLAGLTYFDRDPQFPTEPDAE